MRGKGKTSNRDSGITIIRREEVIEATHHGGAWKVAYADFVTAMMAFFLLMWLLNATTEDQRKGLADYFSPNNLLSHASSGTGQPFGGHTVFDHGAMVSDRGAEQVVVGKRPVVEDPADDDADTTLMADRHGAAAEAGPPGQAIAGKPAPANARAANPPAGATVGASAGAPIGAMLPGQSVAALARAAQLAAARAAAGQAPAGQTAAGQTGAASAGVGPAGAAQSGDAAAGVARTGAADPAEAANPSDTARPSSAVAWAETSTGRRPLTEAEFRAEQERREKQAFEAAAEQIRQAVQGDPALVEIARQLAIDITPEGLRIQLLDEERLAMFPTGSAAPNERAQLLLAKVAPVLMRLPEDIAVVGHTDAAPFAGTGRTNWELSTERANTTRRLLTDDGLAEARISRVTGLADRDPLLPAEPLAAANRRIAIIVLRGTKKPVEPPAQPPGAAPPMPSAPGSAAPALSAPVAPAFTPERSTPQGTMPLGTMPLGTVRQAAVPQGPGLERSVPERPVPDRPVPPGAVSQGQAAPRASPPLAPGAVTVFRPSPIQAPTRPPAARSSETNPP